MGTLISKKAQLVLLAMGLTVAACGGDDEAGPTGGPSLGGDSGVIAVPDAGAGTDGGTAGCFNDKPTESLQFLNKCAEGCQPFDNSKRLPATFTNGKVPALP